ncbi:alpha/beta hydrolase [Streptomyces sp. SP18CS02]|uniref:alpha/beta hydrolase n=1 Tax=Streptomyces sp. SP18CS02 TaxID=3002531 RepID=UPI002E7A5E94|nr:alpha/beta hydrolase [Streptomyces sp. SP18CS02]MEE1752884.1 alpha/beta hydrolase [Streptomyces sp. SP18CS02]
MQYEFAFEAAGERLAATRTTGTGESDPRILSLHGLGPTATRHRTRYLLDALADHGHGSLTFDFSGNGDSTGELARSTLRRRRTETLAAAQWLDRTRPPVVIGTSMGAHLAASTVPELRPSALVLFCPATYPAHAADLPFDGSLVRPANHPDSPAYAGLRHFDGDLLIVGGRKDQVCPPAVIEGYLEHARRARTAEVVWLDGCDHFVHRWLPDQEHPRAEITQAVLRLLTA